MAFINTRDLGKVMDALMSRDEAQCLVAQGIICSAKDGIADPALREQANDEYGTDDIEIDDEPATSPADDGTWVAAWVWVPHPEEETTCLTEGCDGDPTSGEGWDGYCGNCADRLGGKDDDEG